MKYYTTEEQRIMDEVTVHLSMYGLTPDDLYSSVSNNGKPPDVSGSLPLAELGSFVDWIREMNFKQYADGWCEAGGSNGWHCTTDELMKLYRDRRQ